MDGLTRSNSPQAHESLRLRLKMHLWLCSAVLALPRVRLTGACFSRVHVTSHGRLSGTGRALRLSRARTNRPSSLALVNAPLGGCQTSSL